MAGGNAKSRFLNVAFAGRPDVRFGYGRWDFGGDKAPLELAYALTVHKAQGSEFDTVFLVLPRECRLLTRELLYVKSTGGVPSTLLREGWAGFPVIVRKIGVPRPAIGADLSKRRSGQA